MQTMIMKNASWKSKTADAKDEVPIYRLAGMLEAKFQWLIRHFRTEAFEVQTTAVTRETRNQSSKMADVSQTGRINTST